MARGHRAAGAGGRSRGRGLGVALAAVVAVACARPPYPASQRPPARKLSPPRAAPADPGDEAGVRRLEQACRVRLSGQTAESSLDALDRVREIVGASCELETVAADPLFWRLRCSSDSLFESGSYELTTTTEACEELGRARVGRWQCLGGVLASLLPAGEARIERLSVVVLGHADAQPLAPGSEAHLCTELQERLGYRPDVAWEPVAEDAEEEEQRFANYQLAFCRAASVSDQLLAGLSRANGEKERERASLPPGVELSAVGLGTAWLASRPEGRCPDTGEASASCAAARRVDLLVRFEPRADVQHSGCPQPGEGAGGGLCWPQEWMERAAATTRADQDGPGVGVALYTDDGAEPRSLPVGWYQHRLPADPPRWPAFDALCSTVGVAPDRCRVR